MKFVRSRENRGAGANRNQIIDQVADGALIHFIDADMDLETPETPAVAREVAARYADRGVGMIGGLVTFADGRQEWCNHGAVLSVWGNGTGTLQFSIDRLRGRPRLAGALRRVVAPAMRRLAQHTRTSGSVAHLLGPRGKHARLFDDIQVDRRI